jgi:hypothetical protein
MPTTTYTALKAFDLSGRSVAAGENVSLTPVEAAVHARLGRVNLSTPRLHTRDLVAESDTEPPPDPEPPRRRRYHRRDMTAEK